ncbi:MAG: hypothetical protein V9G10_13005 [Candidatus Nanopelagicales bacterium]
MKRGKIILAAVVVSSGLVAPVPAIADGPGVTVTGSVDRIRPEDPAVPSDSAITISAARNEFASAQVIVRAQGAPLTGVSVVQSAPFTKGADTLPASTVTIYREDYYTVTTPSDGEVVLTNPCTVNCRWPDALIPTVDPIHNQPRNAWPVTVPAGENRVAWIDVLVPEGQAPGLYTSTFQARQNGVPIGDVTVSLKVVDWTMPTTSSLQGTFALDWHNICRTWGGNGNDCSSVPGGLWAMYGQIVRMMLDSRVSVSGPAAGAPTTGNMALFDQYALPYIKGTGPTRLPGARLSTVLLNRWEDWAMSHWRSKAVAEGFEDRVTFYCDEVAQNAATWNSICNTPFALAQTNWNAGDAPDTPLPSAIIGTWQDMAFARGQNYPISAAPLQTVVPLVTRVHTGPSFDSGAPNWWGAYPGQTFFGNQRSLYDAFLTERPGYNRLWLYTSCMTEGCGDAYDGHVRYSGWPSYAIDQLPGEARAMAWQVFNHRATGEYYYEISKHLDTAFTDQYEDGGQGDGTLIYPGKTSRIGGATDTVLESIRLKQIREGREDYEYLVHLSATGRDVQARSIAGYYSGAEGPYGSAGGLQGAMNDSSRSQQAYDQARAALEALTAGDDPVVQPTCNGRPATIVGNGSTVLGTPGDDVIVGTSGEDNIYAGAGDDTICGRAGYDTIRPGSGADWADGGPGGNAIDYSDADHGVEVDLGNGTADGDQMRDFDEVFGSIHNDRIIGDDSANFLAGNVGDDRIEGRGGDDLLWGRSSDVPGPLQSDDDTLLPGPGADRVFGYEGSDTIDAVDATHDDVNCGPGRDIATTDSLDVTIDCEPAPQPDVEPPPAPPVEPPVCSTGTYLDSGRCVTMQRLTASARIARPNWKPLACGRSSKNRCAQAHKVHVIAALAPDAGLAGQAAVLRFERKVGKHWLPAKRVVLAFRAAQQVRLTRVLPKGKWRVRVQVDGTPRALAAASPWRYVLVT